MSTRQVQSMSLNLSTFHKSSLLIFGEWFFFSLSLCSLLLFLSPSLCPSSPKSPSSYCSFDSNGAWLHSGSSPLFCSWFTRIIQQVICTYRVVTNKYILKWSSIRSILRVIFIIWIQSISIKYNHFYENQFLAWLEYYRSFLLWIERKMKSGSERQKSCFASFIFVVVHHLSPRKTNV